MSGVKLHVRPESAWLYEKAAAELGFELVIGPAVTSGLVESPEPVSVPAAPVRPPARPGKRSYVRDVPEPEPILPPVPPVTVSVHRSNHPDPRLPWVATARVNGVTRYRYGTTADDAERRLRAGLEQDA